MVMRGLSLGHLEGVWGTSLSLQAGGTLAREEADFGGAGEGDLEWAGLAPNGVSLGRRCRQRHSSGLSTPKTHKFCAVRESFEYF